LKKTRHPHPTRFCYVLQIQDLQRSVVYVLQLKDLARINGNFCKIYFAYSDGLMPRSSGNIFRAWTFLPCASSCKAPVFNRLGLARGVPYKISDGENSPRIPLGD
jgi:hypothetical protein